MQRAERLQQPGGGEGGEGGEEEEPPLHQTGPQGQAAGEQQQGAQEDARTQCSIPGKGSLLKSVEFSTIMLRIIESLEIVYFLL